MIFFAKSTYHPHQQLLPNVNFYSLDDQVQDFFLPLYTD